MIIIPNRQFNNKIVLLCALIALAMMTVPIEGMACKAGYRAERVTIDFERDGDGNTLSVGDIPFRLPENITVTGYRRDGTGGRQRQNDLVVGYASRALRRKHALFVKDENSDPSNPSWFRTGGSIFFNFEKPIHQVNEIEFVNRSPIRRRRSDTKILARLEGSERLATTMSNRGNETTVKPGSWYNVRNLRVLMHMPGAVKKMVVSVCRERECIPKFEVLVAALRDRNRALDTGTAISDEFVKYGDIKNWCFSPSLTRMDELSFRVGLGRFDISGWNVSHVTSMRYMFSGAHLFNGDLSLWDVSSVTDMQRMFRNAKLFNGDISQWDVSSVESMNAMFRGATVFNSDISSWNVSSVSDTQRMFSWATRFNSDISEWDVSSLTSSRNMFIGAQRFNSDISRWNVSSISEMDRMFAHATSFNSDISLWDVSSVTGMRDMFGSAAIFNSDISNWNVSSVTNMELVFWSAQSFNRDISQWDVSSVTEMRRMFDGATSFNQNLCAWGSKLMSLPAIDDNSHLQTFGQAAVGGMFSHTVSCPESGNPENTSNGPFCHSCAIPHSDSS